MTERRSRSLWRDRETLSIGPSQLSWDGTSLRATLDEISTPYPTRVQGTITLHPTALAEHVFELGRGTGHRWRAIAPSARIEVRFTHPRLCWSGSAYFDSNWGPAPLATDFANWDWSRARLSDGSTAVLYDVQGRSGESVALALKFDEGGGLTTFPAPPRYTLPATGWRIRRATRSDERSALRVERTLEDTPFYARSLVSSHLLGEPVEAIHESLSLDRFSSRWVQCLLPFRMPRTLR